ncbi:MAG: acylphosphatase [uncultured DHVE6 group euryarchaeote]|jgi:acylphosphatase|nr:MAG: acylphosphatase [uncultured DHVE6 group euryarchaeote]
MEKLCAEILVTGKVQGVFYRTHTKRFALELKLKGYVQNQNDGSVKIIVQGTKPRIKELELWCWQGPKLANVENVQIQYTRLSKEFTTFERR